MALFGWNKKKNNDDKVNKNADVNKESNSVDELSEEMKIIMETKEEEDLAQKQKLEEEQKKQAEITEKLMEQEAHAMSAFKSDRKAVLEGEANGNVLSRASFYLTVLDTPPMVPEKEGNFFVAGVLRGKLKKGQEVYLYGINFKNYQVIVDSIKQVYSDVEEAEDSAVILEINPNGTEAQAAKYSVITDCPPTVEPAPGVPFESPYYLALSFEFDKLSSDKVYFNILLGAAIHSNFLVPAIMNNVGGEQKVGFMSLKQSDDESINLIAAFTDIRSMERGIKDFRKENANKKIMVLSFHDVARISLSSNNQGFVINPFGPVSFRVSNEHIKQICSSEAYKKEFGDINEKPVPAAPKVVEKKIPDGAKVMLAVPDNNDTEYLNVRDAILKVCKSNDHIQRLGITIRVDETGKQSYLAIVDCGAIHMQSVYKELFEAAKSYLSEVKQIEFILYSEAKFADDYFALHPLVYDNSDGQDI